VQKNRPDWACSCTLSRIVAVFLTFAMAEPNISQAETSTESISGNPRVAYFDLKKIIRTETKVRHPKMNPIDLYFRGCRPWSEAEGVLHGPLRIALVELASHVLFLDDALLANGYPASVYKSELATYENDHFAYIETHRLRLNDGWFWGNDMTFLKQLAMRLNQKRVSLRARP
jgi:hypothetical protein